MPLQLLYQTHSPYARKVLVFAHEAGLAAGDTITAIGGTTVGSASELSTVLAGHQPGDRVSVTWRTAAGKAHTATLTLGSSPIN